MQEMCCAKVCSQEATILVFMGRAGSFFEKKEKDSGRSIFFFYYYYSEKNIMDRLNAIVRFVLSLGNMSNVLHRNKKTGLCHEKKDNHAQNIFLSV